MGSSLPLILHIFSTLFPSPSVFFFHSFLSGPYSLPLPIILSLPTFFFLPSLFSFSSFLSPYFPPSSSYLLSCLLSFLFLSFPSFSLFLRSLFSPHVMSQSCLPYPTLPEHPSPFSSLSFPALLLSLRHPPPPYCLCCLLSLPPLS